MSELGIGGAPPRVVAAAFVVFLLVTSVICGRAMKPPLPAVACLTLLVGTGLDVGRPLVQKGGSSYDAVVSATAGEDHAHAPVPELARDAPPDVYYIVTDGLARPDILRSRFGVDADPATDHLRRLGVTVIGRSRSNYAHTHLSLASSLNGVYIEPSLAATFAQDDRRPLDDLIRRGDMLARFRALGYEFVMVASDTTITPGCDDSNWLRSQAFSG